MCAFKHVRDTRLVLRTPYRVGNGRLVGEEVGGKEDGNTGERQYIRVLLVGTPSKYRITMNVD
jgi:hypothetical protein